MGVDRPAPWEIKMQKNYKLLHLDDDPLEHRALLRQLNNTTDILFEVESAFELNQFNEILGKKDDLDFVVLDIFFAGASKISGLNLIEKVKKSHPKATLLMSSNLDDPHCILQCLQLGADEFLSKKIPCENLVQRLVTLHEKTLIKKGY